MARQISCTASPDPGLLKTVTDVGRILAQAAAGPMLVVLNTVAQLDLVEAIVWCGAGASSVRRLADELDLIDRLTGRVVRVGEARILSGMRAEVRSLDDAIAVEVESRRDELGSMGDDPDPDDLELGGEWVAAVRTHFGGPVRRRVAKILLETDVWSSMLRDPLAAFVKCADALFGEFVETYGQALRRECDESFEAAAVLVDELLNTVGDIHEWAAYVAARSELCSAGWESTIRSCEEQAVASEQVGPLVERTILTRWADEVIASDPRLEPRRTVDRDRLLADFRELDKELVADAAAGVINACTARRPRSLVGQAGVINKQAQLKRRHMPVRRLLEQAGEAAQQLKPCLMMSPLSVSQFLPPGLAFDVVIFDEASQVREADAICSIYRGTQLIVAGDPNQLPPTDFFTRTVAGDDDPEDADVLQIDEFESVLAGCSGIA